MRGAETHESIDVQGRADHCILIEFQAGISTSDLAVAPESSHSCIANSNKQIDIDETGRPY